MKILPSAVMALEILLSANFLSSPSPARADSSPSSEASPNAQDEFWAKGKGVQLGPLLFDFGGQARLRYENDDDFTLKGYAPGKNDQLLLSRLRLDFSLRYEEDARLFLQLQDAHPFLTQYRDSDFPLSSPIEDSLDVRQLYLEWLNIAGSPIGFRVGRQQISYGDQRVFGPGSWGNTGRYAWDAAMLIVNTEWLEADVWTGRYLLYKSDAWPDQPVEHFMTDVAYFKIKKLPFRLDLFYVYKYDYRGEIKGESGTGNLHSHTWGFQAEGRAFKNWDWGATFAGQSGDYGKDTIRAYGANAKLGFTFPTEWSPRLGGQFTWGSGDHDPTDGVHETFDGVYGGRDIFFYGYLNLFTWANLHDLEADFSLRPHRTLQLYAEYHNFNLDDPHDAWYTTGLSAYRRDPTGRSGTALGDEIDLRAVWTLWNHLELMGGYGQFIPGAFVENTGPAATASWFFFQAAYSW